MKNIKIYHSAYGREGFHISESAGIEVDLSALENFYAAMGEKHLRSLQKFIVYWKSEGYERFFNPQAVIRTLPIKTAADNFGTKTLPLNDSVDQIVMAVWTIGAELEKEASEMMSSLGNLMTGFLLDVAGSIALYNMHAELTAWIKENIAVPDNKFINGEFYPGMGSIKQDLMERVVTLGETERMIGVSASGDSLLRPRKSQCSFTALGSSEHEIEVKMEPCRPCTGKKCLYYQLGGCHMMTCGSPGLGTFPAQPQNTKVF
ncbi:hypothetical protein [Cloacibacillus evryensis]|uniref:hypothetical protein n=1 Tax=Cloacibacillus evryensis TaxID=508460 RepID=UPI002673E316|nr:hypothetical protein [Cloacibacillus evryensis]